MQQSKGFQVTSDADAYRGRVDAFKGSICAGVFGGITIVMQDNWPRELVGYDTKQIPAHPFICWLARWLPITPYVEVQVPCYREMDMLLHGAADVVYCSHAQYAELCRHFEVKVQA